MNAPRTALLLGLLLGLAILGGCVPPVLEPVNDETPPTVTILSPRPGERLTTPTPTFEVAYDDAGSSVAAVTFRARVSGGDSNDASNRDVSAEFDHHSRGATAAISPVRPLPLGENTLVVEVADRNGNVGRAEVTFVNAAGGWLRAVTTPGAEPGRNVELVLDASGSMGDALGLGTRMAAAKDAVRELVVTLPPRMALGLRAFYDCGDIAALMPIAPVDRKAFLEQLDGIEPTRGTPLVASLLQSLDALSRTQEGERIAVLVTDGGESCDGDFADAINRAKDAAARIIVIGFDIDDAGLLDELRELAESTGGSFFDAADPSGLASALERSVLRLRYRVLDDAGKVVAAGEVDGVPLELPLGHYQLRLEGIPPLLVEDLIIGPLARTTVTLRASEAGLTAEVESVAGP